MYSKLNSAINISELLFVDAGQVGLDLTVNTVIHAGSNLASKLSLLDSFCICITVEITKGNYTISNHITLIESEFKDILTEYRSEPI